MVKPSRKASGAGRVTRVVVPSVITEASREVAPEDPLKAVARMPAASGGRMTVALADWIGTSHSSPVAFQYSSS